MDNEDASWKNRSEQPNQRAISCPQMRQEVPSFAEMSRPPLGTIRLNRKEQQAEIPDGNSGRIASQEDQCIHGMSGSPCYEPSSLDLSSRWNDSDKMTSEAYVNAD
jgi:hypothetical protein